MNLIKANNEQKKVIKGEPKKVTELLDGTLLVEICNEQRSILLQQLSKLNNIGQS